MRVAIVGLMTALSLISAAAGEPKANGSVCTGEVEKEYRCEWQQKLLLAQHEFAATLNTVDATTTGSITQIDR